MREDFAVLILTHGRADNVITLKTLERGGYTGKWYLVLDDQDEQQAEYERRYGSEHIIIFDKQAAYERTDTMDNFGDMRVVVFARNECWRIARGLGLKYFLVLDDDYLQMIYRFEDQGKLRTKAIRDLDRAFTATLKFLDNSGAVTVAWAQNGDFIGGVEGGNYRQGLLRKAMNTWFCRTDREFQFSGTINEDCVTPVTLGSRGTLFLTVTMLAVKQVDTQAAKGGLSDIYLDRGTYVKSFYAVISAPSCVKVSSMMSEHERIHHKVSWNNAVPKILNERVRKKEE